MIQIRVEPRHCNSRAHAFSRYISYLLLCHRLPQNLWSWNHSECLLSHTVSMSKEFCSCLPWVLRIFHSGSGSLTRLRSKCQRGLQSAESCLEAGGSSSQWLMHMADKPAGGLSSLPRVPLPKAAGASSRHGSWLSTEFTFKEGARWKLQFWYFSGLASEVTQHYFHNILLVTRARPI